ncbi:MAG: DUF3866 family protein [Gaiellaceae bacterium]
MLTLRRGTVTGIEQRHDGLVRLVVEGRACVAYPDLTGPVAVGDDVLVNVQASELGLGTGGFDVLHANLTRGLGLPAEAGAHVMKLPYTPLQHAVLHAEEGEDEGTGDLAGMPVVCCSLHSQVAPVCAGLGREERVAYVQLPGGALPLPLSDAVRTLREEGYLATTVAVGPCFGGEVACVSVASALVACARTGMRAAVCAIGPGVVGTSSRYGHGGLAAAEAANAASALGGAPVLAARVSEADPRERHRGVSHHTLAVFALVQGPLRVAWPEDAEPPAGLADVERVDVSGWREACAGLPLSHMGRTADEEPAFFAAAYAAGALARTLAR